MSFAARRINATFVLGEGDFGTAGQDTVEVSGLRVSAHVNNAGGRSMGTADCRIYGMKLATMNRLSTLGVVATMLRRNSITLSAGDEGKPLSTFFQGTIINAWMDAGHAPEVAFHVTAQTGAFDAVRPAQPISIRGSADVVSMLAGLATQMGLGFENNGVDAKLPGPYYAGTPFLQAQQIVRDAGIEWNAAESGTLAIWNAGGSRGDTAIVVEPPGLIVYPTFTSNGVMVKVQWNPSIGLGSKIDIRSSLREPLARALSFPNAPQSSGYWVVYKIDHHLEAQMPRGRWESTILAAPPGTGPFVA